MQKGVKLTLHKTQTGIQWHFICNIYITLIRNVESNSHMKHLNFHILPLKGLERKEWLNTIILWLGKQEVPMMSSWCHTYWLIPWQMYNLCSPEAWRNIIIRTITVQILFFRGWNIIRQFAKEKKNKEIMLAKCIIIFIFLWVSLELKFINNVAG